MTYLILGKYGEEYDVAIGRSDLHVLAVVEHDGPLSPEMVFEKALADGLLEPGDFNLNPAGDFNLSSPIDPDSIVVVLAQNYHLAVNTPFSVRNTLTKSEEGSTGQGSHGQ